jgi:hypothetical protein
MTILTHQLRPESKGSVVVGLIARYRLAEFAAPAHVGCWHSTAVRCGATSRRVLEILRTLGAPWSDHRP